MKEKKSPSGQSGFNESYDAYIRVPQYIAQGIFSHCEITKIHNKLHLALLILSNHSDGITVFNGKSIPCKEGELITSIPILSDKMNMSEAKTRRLLKNLEEKREICLERIYKGIIIRVNNYRQKTKPGLFRRLATAKPPQENPAGPSAIRTTPEETRQYTIEKNKRHLKILQERLNNNLPNKPNSPE